jgi:hypothetical protein
VLQLFALASLHRYNAVLQSQLLAVPKDVDFAAAILVADFQCDALAVKQ